MAFNVGGGSDGDVPSAHLHMPVCRSAAASVMAMYFARSVIFVSQRDVSTLKKVANLAGSKPAMAAALTMAQRSLFQVHLCCNFSGQR